jgi:hypothetical protein
MSQSSDKVTVLLDGSKTFWKTRSYLKIIIAKHSKQNCLEIIAYDPADGIEFPRIYLDSLLVISKLDKDAIEKAYAAKKEALIRSKIKKNREEILDEIRVQMMMQYAYSRIQLSPKEMGKLFKLSLQPTFDDVTVEGKDNNKRIDVECEMPEGLTAFEVVKTIVKS